MPAADYIPPHEVTSPKERWSLIQVLHDGGEGEASYALGYWEADIRVGCRWNGWAGAELGFPQSAGRPTWFMLPEPEGDAVIARFGVSKLMLRVAMGAWQSARERYSSDQDDTTEKASC